MTDLDPSVKREKNPYFSILEELGGKQYEINWELVVRLQRGAITIVLSIVLPDQDQPVAEVA
ncbi:uncharacterized protein PHALS_11479 [Plasmopara halstedii]|uniref:Uncharacterized protein n=1 Tax=Plasmopara halstedii TaxID=4781 RepID=A0A0P1A6M6_PLAHL|nr:uncharacterized protein PHALS_11479 [Plasmopara halstedii]CEG35608.1 hypothetical protein PHALS_11479 [Plasmopara halstedii]|eukprot:XP_024571977.1 hypothetical protein PHALS_11479 [Plasmopara halstedii]